MADSMGTGENTIKMDIMMADGMMEIPGNILPM
jgi:hypothetical protein